MIHYKNGNYNVMFDENNGTKIRYNNLDTLVPEFPENIDCRISSICSIGCKMCYEGNTLNGKYGDIMNQKWVDSLHPYTEIAIGVNDPIHPDLENFLNKLKSKKVFPSITVNQRTFERYFGFIHRMYTNKLVYGIGVSLIDPNPDFISRFKMFDTGVLHVVNGIITEEQIDAIKNKDLKVLILGYKNLGRGIDCLNTERDKIIKNMIELKSAVWNGLDRQLNVLSFDNLAINQLDIKGMFKRDGRNWDEFFMGRDSEYTFYIDAVNHKFAGSSLATDKFEITDDVTEMFNRIRGKYSIID